MQGGWPRSRWTLIPAAPLFEQLRNTQEAFAAELFVGGAAREMRRTSLAARFATLAHGGDRKSSDQERKSALDLNEAVALVNVGNEAPLGQRHLPRRTYAIGGSLKAVHNTA